MFHGTSLRDLRLILENGLRVNLALTRSQDMWVAMDPNTSITFALKESTRARGGGRGDFGNLVAYKA
jgi:hypothetical protein